MERFVALLVLVLLVCSCVSEEPTATPGPIVATSTTAAATTTSSTVPTTSTTPLSSTATSLPAVPAPATIWAPVRGVGAPLSGWIVSETPYVIGIVFWGTPFPDSVTINDAALHVDDAAGQVFVSPPIDLEPGVNQLHMVVEYRSVAVEEAVIPVTYLEGAESLLGWITAATEDSITVDLTEWDDNQEFPGPEDPDPGVLTSSRSRTRPE